MGGDGSGSKDEQPLTIGWVERPSRWLLLFVSLGEVAVIAPAMLALAVLCIAGRGLAAIIGLALPLGLVVGVFLVVAGPLPESLQSLTRRCWAKVGGTWSADFQRLVFRDPNRFSCLGTRLPRRPMPHSVPLAETAIAWRPTSDSVELIAYDGGETLLREVSDAKSIVNTVRRIGRPRRSYRLRLMSARRRLSRVGVTTVVLVCVATAAALSQTMVGVWAFSVAACLGLLHVTAPLDLELGADGVRVRRSWIFPPVFLPYRTLSSIEIPLREQATSPDRLPVLVHRHAAGTMSFTNLDRSRASLLKALLDEGIAMARQGEAVGASVTSLARAGDDVERWSRRLDTALGHATYRQAAVEPEQLAALLCNPAAVLEQRTAAAVALRHHADGPRAIERALAVCSDPALSALLHRLRQDEPVEAVLRAVGDA